MPPVPPVLRAARHARAARAALVARLARRPSRPRPRHPHAVSDRPPHVAAGCIENERRLITTWSPPFPRFHKFLHQPPTGTSKKIHADPCNHTLEHNILRPLEASPLWHSAAICSADLQCVSGGTLRNTFNTVQFPSASLPIIIWSPGRMLEGNGIFSVVPSGASVWAAVCLRLETEFQLSKCRRLPN